MLARHRHTTAVRRRTAEPRTWGVVLLLGCHKRRHCRGPARATSVVAQAPQGGLGGQGGHEKGSDWRAACYCAGACSSHELRVEVSSSTTFAAGLVEIDQSICSFLLNDPHTLLPGTHGRGVAIGVQVYGEFMHPQSPMFTRA